MSVDRGGRGWVRVIAGEFRGRRLATLPGRELRPTSDRVRESLFGILGDRVVDARIVDCFAGTGALGIEALSRGAAFASFVERDPRALGLLEENLGRLELTPRARVIRADALHPEKWPSGVFPARIVFADPPYRQDLGARFLSALEGRLEPGGLLVLEHERAASIAHPAWTVVDHRTYGETAITFLTSPEKENAA